MVLYALVNFRFQQPSTKGPGAQWYLNSFIEYPFLRKNRTTRVCRKNPRTMASCSARRVRLGDLKGHRSVHGKGELKVFFGVKTFWKSMHMVGGGLHGRCKNYA